MNDLNRKVEKMKKRRRKNLRKMKKKAMYMAVLAYFKGNDWVVEFFVDIINKRLKYAPSSEKEIWAPGTDGGTDWMRDMMKVHGLTEQEALQKAREEGVMAKVYMPDRQPLTRKQKNIYKKYEKNWKSGIRELSNIMPDIEDQWGGFTFSLKPEEGLIVRSGFTSKNDMEALESKFNVVLDSESGKIVSQEQMKEQRFGPKINILQSLQEEVISAGDDWTEDFLNSLISRAQKGKPFTDKQKEILFDKMHQYGYEEEIEEFGGDPDSRTSLEDEEKQEVLDELLDYAQDMNDDWLENFVKSVTRQISKGKNLSDKQIEIIQENAEDAEIDSAKADLFKKNSFNKENKMSNLKNQLIKLGSDNPNLRKHLRPILHKVEKSAASGRVIGRMKGKTPQRGGAPFISILEIRGDRNTGEITVNFKTGGGGPFVSGDLRLEKSRSWSQEELDLSGIKSYMKGIYNQERSFDRQKDMEWTYGGKGLTKKALESNIEKFYEKQGLV